MSKIQRTIVGRRRWAASQPPASAGGNGGVGVRPPMSSSQAPAAFSELESPPDTTTQVRPRRSRREIFATIVLAIVAVAALALTARALFLGSPTYAGAVQPVARVDLDFQSIGRLTDIQVKPGEHVRAGQVLARQDPTLANANLDAARATLSGEQAQLALLQSPPTDLSLQQLQLAVQQANQQFSGAQQGLGNANQVGNAGVLSAQTALANARAAQQSDQALYNSTCGQSPQTLECQRLQQQLSRDAASVGADEQALQQAQTAAKQAHDNATKAVTVAQTGLTLAENNLSLKTAPPTPLEIQTLKAQVDKDSALVDVSQKQLDDLVLVAPMAGLVMNVNGNVGDLVGGSGVRSYQGSATVIPVQPGFQISATAPPQSAAGAGSSYSALIQLGDDSAWQVVTQVPEANITKVALGEQGTVKFGALDGSAGCKVIRIAPAPQFVGGGIYYLVTVDLTGAPKGLLPGMTASVALGSG